ncbi:DUF6090 family protein [Winogradskyella sp. PE311]|uniref:DUF6090 family protein n=1 Tax=Winogradskyella sp. PE311 TaxID=3366943 RepID=UPI003980235C
MIKFFRRIRQQLLSENKFSKYLLYAVGEIILVIIGILIALGINDQNDQRKNNASEAKYYCKILDDFEADKILREELKLEVDKKVRLSKELMLELASGEKDKRFLVNKFLKACRNNTYVPRKTTYQDLVSTGNMKLLRDESIRNSLIEFYSQLDNKLISLEENREELIKEFYKILNTSIDFGAYEFEYVNNLIGAEVLATIPENDWHKDKSSSYYRNFQKILIFNIGIADRQKQHFEIINTLMEKPYKQLSNKCKAE